MLYIYSCSRSGVNSSAKSPKLFPILTASPSSLKAKELMTCCLRAMCSVIGSISSPMLAKRLSWLSVSFPDGVVYRASAVCLRLLEGFSEPCATACTRPACASQGSSGFCKSCPIISISAACFFFLAASPISIVAIFLSSSPI